MRERLNNDPKVQIIVLAVVGVIAAILLFTTVLKKDPAAAPPVDPNVAATTPAEGGTDPAAAATDPAATPPAATTPAPTTPVDPAAATPVDPAATTPVTPPEGGADLGAADGLLPTKGLPKDVLVAYASNKAIALLVIDPRGLSDQRLESFTAPLRSRDDLSIFTVETEDIGDYSRITSGVSIDRVPALIVIRPRRLTEGAPTATVSYGFRSPRSVKQAVEDALYEGKQATSYP